MFHADPALMQGCPFGAGELHTLTYSAARMNSEASNMERGDESTGSRQKSTLISPMDIRHVTRFTRNMSSSTRDLSVEQSLQLNAGDDHYRAYVGPPGRYDVITGLQFSILTQLGLRDTHRVLDFGCGSLRLGRLLIPFLRPDRYFGIDPNRWLIEAGIERELGRDVVNLKRPRFDHNDRYDCSAFGVSFDFIMAQSILTHTGFGASVDLCRSIRSALAPGGLAVVNWIVEEQDGPEVHSVSWLYPGCHPYSAGTIQQIYQEASVAVRATNWWHPGRARWDILCSSEGDLPTEAELSKTDFMPLIR